ncbi:alpha/beta fold hydrolase [Methylopila sp. M107]|uniref:alpha/beta hydrolase n=1 Tax=Methylopila sp. M107 TaxID=1101190 RepID=UPI000360417A|nr:alpha/beta fold hydrolase [Methylopila sp. M107]
MSGYIVKIAIGAAALYGLVCLAMFMAQKSFLFHPTPVTGSPDVYGLGGFQRVTITTEDGAALVGWFHDNPSREKALVYFYGNADALPPYAGFFDRLARSGYSVLAVNYRGYGGSTGAPSEQGFYRDGDAALRFLAGRVSAEKITVMGRSIGSGVAVDLAARNPVGLLVLISPFTSIPNVASKLFWWLPVNLLMTERFASNDKIKAVRAPVLVIHGDADTLIPPEEGRRLYEAANEPKRLEILPGVDHIDIDFGRVFELVAAFEGSTLGRS